MTIGGKSSECRRAKPQETGQIAMVTGQWANGHLNQLQATNQS
jgi:hypothetical protein